jgi:hypothetical protein
LVKHQEQQSEEIGYSVANEEISESLLLRCWNKTLEPVYEAIAVNKESGAKYHERFVNYLDELPMDVKQKKRWLASVINPKTGDYYTLDQLIAAGKISAAEKKLYGDKPLPRRELTQLLRYQTDDGREWLVRTEIWYGLNISGAVVSISVNNLDFAKQVVPRAESTPQDPTVQGSPEVKILQIGRPLPSYETANKLWLTPFTKENLLSALQKASKPSDPRLHGHISLSISKDGAHNPISVSDLDTFTNADFNDLWTRLTSPAPQINLNPKSLETFIKMDRESRESHEQYK